MGALPRERWHNSPGALWTGGQASQQVPGDFRTFLTKRNKQASMRGFSTRIRLVRLLKQPGLFWECFHCQQHFRLVILILEKKLNEWKRSERFDLLCLRKKTCQTRVQLHQDSHQRELLFKLLYPTICSYQKSEIQSFRIASWSAYVVQKSK